MLPHGTLGDAGAQHQLAVLRFVIREALFERSRAEHSGKEKRQRQQAATRGQGRSGRLQAR